MDTRPNTERGQAVVLIVLAIVALLGFTALAVDGSMIYSDRRYAQSSADSSSLAGSAAAANEIAVQYITEASWNCNSGVVAQAGAAARLAAIDRAQSNNISIDEDITDENGVDIACVNQATEKYMDIIVDITQETETAFAHFIYGGPLTNTVRAVSRIYPRKSLAFGYTIVALNPAGCQGQQNGALFHGNPGVLVCGGGIFSNGCLRGQGNIDVSVDDFDCNPVDHGIYYATELQGGGFVPGPESASHLPPNAYRLDYTPDELCEREGANIVDAGDLPEPIPAGLWCISGDIALHGSHGDMHGDGVTLVMLDGSITCNGNCEMQLSAPGPDPDPYPAVPGLLIYSFAAVRGTGHGYKLNGNNNSYFHGTILTPEADITMLGTGNEDSFMTQVICWDFEGGGTNDSTYKWNDQIMFSKPVQLELNQ